MYRILEVGEDAPDAVYPQVEHMGPDYRWDDPDSVSAIVSNEPLVVPPNLRAFHLDAETEPTDLISQGYIYRVGLLASERFFDTLAAHVVQRYEAYPAEVVWRDETLPYRWIHMTELVEPLLDYARSEFALREPDGDERPLPTDSAAALREASKRLAGSTEGRIVAKRIAFASGTPRYDLFSLGISGHVYFVSGELADELLERRLTGFELRDTEAVISFE